jgi:hypothetical protein
MDKKRSAETVDYHEECPSAIQGYVQQRALKCDNEYFNVKNAGE